MRELLGLRVAKIFFFVALALPMLGMTGCEEFLCSLFGGCTG